MLRFSRSLLSRKDVGDANGLSGLRLFSSLSGYSSAATEASTRNEGRTYANYAIFKGKAALSLSPILPKFSMLRSGSSVIDKKGCLLLSFMPAIGTRKYDHEKKQVFALSDVELGSLISLGPSESCEFFHDPSMKSSEEGKVKKTLLVSPMGTDGGYFFNLSVMNSILKTNDRLSVPVTKAEFAVIRNACSFVLPHILGWDRALRPPPRTHKGGGASMFLEPERLDPDSEWRK